MSGMGGFYASPYQSIDPRPTMDQIGVDEAMANMGTVEMDDDMMGDSLDDIINQNNREMQRRRTMDAGYSTNGNYPSHTRRSSMMEFTSGDDSGLTEFGFDPAPAQSSFQNPQNSMNILQKASGLRKARSKEDITLNAAYPAFGQVFDSFQNDSSFSSPVHASASMSMPSANYLQNNIGLSMDFQAPATNISPANYSTSPQQAVFTQSPMNASFPASYLTPTQPMTGIDVPSDEQTIMEKVAQMSMPGALAPSNASTDTLKPVTSSGVQSPQHLNAIGSANSNMLLNQSEDAHPQYMTGGESIKEWMNGMAKTNDPKGLPRDTLPTVKNDVPLSTQFPNAYSASGFDMLGVLVSIIRSLEYLHMLIES